MAIYLSGKDGEIVSDFLDVEGYFQNCSIGKKIILFLLF